MESIEQELLDRESVIARARARDLIAAARYLGGLPDVQEAAATGTIVIDALETKDDSRSTGGGL